MTTFKQYIFNNVNLVSFTGFIGAKALQLIEQASYFFELAAPILSAIVAVSVIIYNIKNIKKLDEDGNKKNEM